MSRVRGTVIFTTKQYEQRQDFGLKVRGFRVVRGKKITSNQMF